MVTHSVVQLQASLQFLLISFFFFFFQNPRSCQAQSQQLLTDCPGSSANYTPGSKFEYNLKTLLIPTLIANGSLTGFYQSITGDNTDTVYGLAQCRGDISKEECKSCLNATSVDMLQNLCPNKLDATVRYEKCLLRCYSNVNFFSESDNNGMLVLSYVDQNVSDQGAFSRELEGWLNNAHFSFGASSKPSKFQTGSTTFEDIDNMYGLVQCTRDISATDCLSCLQTLINYIPGSVLYGKRVAHILSKSCVLRYANVLFYDQSLLPPPPPGHPHHHKFHLLLQPSTNLGVIVGPIVAGVTFIVLCVCILMRKRINKAISAITVATRENMLVSLVHLEESQQNVNGSYDINNDNQVQRKGIDVPLLIFKP